MKNQGLSLGANMVVPWANVLGYSTWPGCTRHTWRWMNPLQWRKKWGRRSGSSCCVKNDVSLACHCVVCTNQLAALKVNAASLVLCILPSHKSWIKQKLDVLTTKVNQDGWIGLCFCTEMNPVHIIPDEEQPVFHLDPRFRLTPDQCGFRPLPLLAGRVHSHWDSLCAHHLRSCKNGQLEVLERVSW